MTSWRAGTGRIGRAGATRNRQSAGIGRIAPPQAGRHGVSASFPPMCWLAVCGVSDPADAAKTACLILPHACARSSRKFSTLDVRNFLTGKILLPSPFRSRRPAPAAYLSSVPRGAVRIIRGRCPIKRRQVLVYIEEEHDQPGDKRAKAQGEKHGRDHA